MYAGRLFAHQSSETPLHQVRFGEHQKEVVDVLTLADRDVFEELGLTKKSPFATDQ